MSSLTIASAASCLRVSEPKYFYLLVRAADLESRSLIASRLLVSGEFFVIAPRLLAWYWISLLLYPGLGPEFHDFTLRLRCTRGLRGRFIWYQNFPFALELRLIVTGLFPCSFGFIVERLGVRAMLVNQQMSRSLSRKGSFLAQIARFRKEHREAEQYPCELP